MSTLYHAVHVHQRNPQEVVDEIVRQGLGRRSFAIDYNPFTPDFYEEIKALLLARFPRINWRPDERGWEDNRAVVWVDLQP